MSYEFSGKVRFSETDEHGYLSLASLVNYFQDVSTFQSEELGIGVDYLKEHKRAWLLASWQIVIDRMPRLCEQVTAATWPYEFKGFMGNRNFTMADADGKLTAWANSIWFLYDQEQQKPTRVDDHTLDLYKLEDRLDMEYAPRKIRVPEEGEEQAHFEIVNTHLDTNHHVNNGQYIEMAIGYLPEGFRIRQVRAEYIRQAFLGDEICPKVSKLENGYTVALNAADGGKPYAVIELTADPARAGREETC